MTNIFRFHVFVDPLLLSWSPQGFFQKNGENFWRTRNLQLPFFYTLKLTWPLKMDGWNISFLWGPGLFSGANLLLVSGRVFVWDLPLGFTVSPLGLCLISIPRPANEHFTGNGKVTNFAREKNVFLLRSREAGRHREFIHWANGMTQLDYWYW